MRVTLKNTLFSLLIVFPIFLLSQEEKKTSAFKEALKNKTAKFNTNRYFIKAQTFFIENEWDSTLLYTMKQLSSTTKERELINYCHFLRGYSFYEKQVFQEAKKEFSKISTDFEFYNNTKMVLGTIALEQGQFNEAIAYFKEIETLQKKDLLGIKKGNIEHNIGLSYFHLKQYEEAEIYLKKSVSLQEKQKDTLELIGSYGNIANFYYEQYKDQQAIPYFEKAYQLGNGSTPRNLPHCCSILPRRPLLGPH